MKIDLHLHTTASDGTDAPAQLAALAAGRGFEAIAVTDHDTTAGLGEALAAGEALGLRVIPGVELSAGGEREVHVLGYGLAPGCGLERELERFCTQRERRLAGMVERLNRAGVPVSLEKVCARAQGAAGRPHLAAELVAMGVVDSVQQAFEKYLSPGRPGYLPKERLTVEEAIDLIRGHGGLAVLAHPGLIQGDAFWLPERLSAWKRAGLEGLEAHHPAHSPERARQLDALARSLGLLVTGGSDYHGQVKTVRMGDGLDQWSRRKEDFFAFLHALATD